MKDPNIAQGIADMVKGFQQKQHESTETVDRYLQVRERERVCVHEYRESLSQPYPPNSPLNAHTHPQDGLEGIKRQEVKQALTAFETALKMDNETGMCLCVCIYIFS